MSATDGRRDATSPGAAEDADADDAPDDDGEAEGGTEDPLKRPGGWCGWRGGQGARTSRLASRASMLHIYALCNLRSPWSPSPSPAASIPPTAFPASPRTAGRCTPSTSTPAAPPPRSARRSGARPRRSAPSQHHEVDARARGLRSLRPLPDPGQRAARRGLSAERRRRADPAGASRWSRWRARIGARGGGPRLDRRRQRPGALRRRAPRARARPRDRDADPRRRRCSASRRSPISRRAACRSRPRPAPTPSTAASGAPPGAAAGPTTPGPARPPSCSSRRPTRRRPRDRARLGAGLAGRRSTACRSRARRWSRGWASSPRRYGIGRSIHVGETALGIKGRIGFEAGAALLLIARPSRAGEAGAHQVADVLEGSARPLLRRPPARGPVLRSRAPRHRGADHQLAAAGHRRDPRPARARAASRSSAPGAPTR